MRPRVSMVMPCYNKENFIGPMLESVAGQRWDNIELIMVNDGSTDGTRAVISQWVPRLKRRGYAVMVVDQENRGAADAVKRGLGLVGGDFVCCVDCDDQLHPEYVSKMASFLVEHPDYDLAACECEVWRRSADGAVADDESLKAARPFEENFLYDFLLFRCGAAVWRYLIRTEYLKACRVAERFFTFADMEAAAALQPALARAARSGEEVYINQEPSFVIPLAAGGGRGFCLPDKLYLHKQLDAGNNVFRRAASEACTEITNHLNRHAIDSLRLPPGERARLESVLELSAIRLRCFPLDLLRGGGGEYARARAAEAAEWVKRAFVPPPGIDCELILKTGYRAFFQAVENRLYGRQNKKPDFGEKGRVIGMGALGNLAGELVPALEGTELQCDLLWDGSARGGERQGGQAVTRPQFEALRPGDVVLVLAKRRRLQEYVEEQLADKPQARRLFFFEVLDFLAAHYYDDPLKASAWKHQ